MNKLLIIIIIYLFYLFIYLFYLFIYLSYGEIWDLADERSMKYL